jgi:cobalt/nickel transport system permease protein
MGRKWGIMALPLKLYLSLIIVIGCALLKLNGWYYLCSYSAIALIWAVTLRVPWRQLAQLLGTELLFLSFVALPLGWERAGFLLLRSLTCLLAINSFLLTLPPHSLSIALGTLPLPRGLKENLLLAGQYIEILVDEVKNMQRSAELRGLAGKAKWLRYASAAMIGSLYLRSLQRAERVYGAMLARGYNGYLPTESKLEKKDLLVVLFASAIAFCITTASYMN